MLSCLHLCKHVRYVTFTTNLNLYSKKKTELKSPQCIWLYLSITILGLLLNECEKDKIFLFFICANPDVDGILLLVPKSCRFFSSSLFSIQSIYIFSIAVTPPACILCIIVFQIWCHSCTKKCASLVANYSSSTVK